MTVHIETRSRKSATATEIYISTTCDKTSSIQEQAREIFAKGASVARDRVKNRLKIFSEKELADDPRATDRVQGIEICEGYPAEAILQKANELDCDEIVMGTHGKGILANTFLGSVTKRVLRRTRKPVFIIPLPRGETDLTVHDDV